jgi:hypothetical protein
MDTVASVELELGFGIVLVAWAISIADRSVDCECISLAPNSSGARVSWLYAWGAPASGATIKPSASTELNDPMVIFLLSVKNESPLINSPIRDVSLFLKRVRRWRTRLGEIPSRIGKNRFF